MSTFEITLAEGPQIFLLELNAIQRRFTVRWCEPAVCWLLDIDSLDGTPIVQALALVPGVDILGQYAHLDLGAALYVQIEGAPDRSPSYADMGVSVGFYLVTP